MENIMTTFRNYWNNMDKKRKVKGFLFFFMIVTLSSSCSQQNNESTKSRYADLVFQNGPEEYINWFTKIAHKRYQIKN